MKVTVAGEKKEIEQGTTIAKLIVDEKVENPEYVTVTVNDEFVESDDFETTQKILASIVHHPNAGGVLLVSLGCENNDLEHFRMNRWSVIPVTSSYRKLVLRDKRSS